MEKMSNKPVTTISKEQFAAYCESLNLVLTEDFTITPANYYAYVKNKPSPDVIKRFTQVAKELDYYCLRLSKVDLTNETITKNFFTK